MGKTVYTCLTYPRSQYSTSLVVTLGPALLRLFYIMLILRKQIIANHVSATCLIIMLVNDFATYYLFFQRATVGKFGVGKGYGVYTCAIRPGTPV